MKLAKTPVPAEGQAEPRAKTPKTESDAAGLFQVESRCEARIIYCGISFRAQNPMSMLTPMASRC